MPAAQKNKRDAPGQPEGNDVETLKSIKAFLWGNECNEFVLRKISITAWTEWASINIWVAGQCHERLGMNRRRPNQRHGLISD